MLRRTMMLIGAVMALAGLAGGGQAPAQLAGEFPLMAWGPAPGDREVLERMRACGLTVAGFVHPEALDDCHAAGLRAIVTDTSFGGFEWFGGVDGAVSKERLAALVERCRGHPAVLGYYVKDEPIALEFPGLAELAAVVREGDPEAWPYINLLPNYATGEMLHARDYADYLEQFISVCDPPIISYDNYSLKEDGTLRGKYFSNLEEIRRASLKHEIPFWNIVLATAHFDYREVNDADMRFQVFTTLAYGGRGISYFTYFAPTVENYRAAAVDQFWNETPTWEILRNVNLQVQKLAPTLLQLTSDRVYHFGSMPEGVSGPDEESLVERLDGDFVVGQFTHEDGSRYLMIVNKRFDRSQVCRPEFRESGTEAYRVSAYTGEGGSDPEEQIWLAPGEGALLKLVVRSGRP